MQQLGVEPPPRHAITGATPETDPNWGAWFRWIKRLVNAIAKVQTFEVTINPASVSANTTSEQTFTVTGLTTSDIVYLNKPTHTTGLGVVNARVSAANTLAVTFMNNTAAPIDAGSETYKLVSVRF
jgi:hypothetical protein